MSPADHKATSEIAPRSRIGTRLFLVGGVLVLLTGLVVALVGATIARQSVLAEAERRVLALVEQREAHLQDWLGAYFDTAERLVLTLYPGMIENNSEYHDVLFSLPGLIHSTLLADDGNPHPGDPIAGWQPDETAVKAAALSREPSFGPLHRQADGTPVFDVVLPARINSKGDSALIALRLNSRVVLDPILTDTSGLGSRGELFLLDRDMRMLTPSRFHSHPEPLMHRMDIPPARAALDSSSGSMEYTSYLGDPVVGGYVYMPRQRWILVGELDVREALAPVKRIYVQTAIILGLSLLVFVVITLFLARTWARPIVRLTRASEQVASGNYDVTVAPPRQQDELHQLTDSFNRMTEALLAGRKELAVAQRRLVQQSTMAAIGQLASSIVHEMRNPLSSIKMNLRLLERQAGSDPQIREHFDLANQEAGRLETMLGELLDYSKPVQPDLQPVNVNEVLQAVAGDLASRLETASIDMQLDLADPPPVAHTDHELLRRSIENLLRNALESLRDSGTIRLVSRADDSGTVQLTVQDNGVGMSERVQERLFDPFFTTRDDGTGLGMANVKRFIDLLDGRIQIDSVEGEGTTVTLTLPGEPS
ncbi:HAMP domain-containing protein [bacterium]|nr:HAMP domain-containing protein [bacterium]